MNKERLVVSLSGGKDSTAMLHMMLERKEKIYKVIFFDSGWEFPQMLEHIDLVEKKTGIGITRIKPKQPFNYWMYKREIKARKGPNKGKVHRIGNGWPSPMRRWCTRLKVDALNKAVNKDYTQCIGFALDESKRTKSKNLENKKVRFPLIEYGVTEEQAIAYCRLKGYDWDGLYDDFDRVSCFCCPLQKINDLRTLRNKYPELWNKMLEMDSLTPNHNRGFRMYDTVHDLDNRFEIEEKQQCLFDIDDFEKKENDWIEQCGSACRRF
jgi:3'-phosphoadenosine 5'-phosphosulfate sulfotransferase (PAPS reductase)/FAD synthetase